MLPERETSPDSLSSAEPPARESTLYMHAELRGVVYLTPTTNQPSTSPDLSKPELPAGPLSFKCHGRRVSGKCSCVCKTVSCGCVCKHKQVFVNGYFIAVYFARSKKSYLKCFGNCPWFAVHHLKTTTDNLQHTVKGQLSKKPLGASVLICSQGNTQSALRQ